MGRSLIWIAAVLACVPSALGGDALAVFDGRARLAFALAPWLFVAGMPRTSAWSWGTAIGLALPGVALAGWLDQRAGIEGAALAGRVGWAALVGGLAWIAAERARGASLYAAAWFACQAALPALAWGAHVLFPDRDGSLVRFGLALSPATESLARASAPGLHPLDGVALIVGSTLLGAAWIARSRPAVSAA